MEDLDRLARDFGLGPRGKSNPMRSTADHRSKNSPLTDYDFDSMFKTTSSDPKYSYNDSSNNKAESSLPMYDKPLYDEDVPNVRFDNDAFASISSPQSTKSRGHKSDFGDLFDNLGRNDRSSSAKSSSVSKGFDDLLPGYGSGASAAASNRPTPVSSQYSVPSAGSKHKNDPYDPFVVLESTSTPGSSSSGVFTDSADWMSKLGKSSSARAETSSGSGGAFDDLESLRSSGKPTGSFSPRTDNRGKNGSPSGPAMYRPDSTTEQKRNASFRFSETNTEKKVPVDKFQDPPVFDMPNVPPRDYDPDPQINMFPTSGHGQQSDDVWLTVSEIPLFTQPTAAPPPSRPPPPLPHRNSRSETGSFSSLGKKGDDSFSTYDLHSQSPKSSGHVAKGPPVSQVDELENFGMGKSHNSVDERATFYPSEDTDGFSSAAASAAGLEDAMSKAQAKFRQAKEVREREYVKAARSREPEQLGKGAQGWDEIESRETQGRLEHERKQKEEEEREQRRLEREREIEREKARHAVERASREARERAAAEAREKAAAETRRRSERAAVEKANAEARGRAERAAVQRAQAEARERAAAEAKLRAEKAAAEARDRAAAESRERVAAEAREREVQDKAAVARAEAEARRRAERAAVDRAAAEARGRAAAEARERAASATKMNQQKNDIDMEAFFGMGRASSAPRTRADSTDPFDQRSQNSGGSEAAKKAPSSTGTSSSMKKASSTTNIVDDLSSLFGGTSSNGEFQEVEGEPEERRRARLDRHQRTQERTAKALAEKNQRDLQAQRDQEERHRISETLDFEIKRWAAGKEGNLRALLSTLQYVLWPECGWQAVSLTDLITGASVKKAYRKATLCIHPDKVQQKGASLQQKYIAEKVFDLLKEAWNKFNSEELF